MKFWKIRSLAKRSNKIRKRNRIVERLEDRRLLAGDLGLPSDMIANPYAFVGDHSWSNSEIWSMTVGDVEVTAPDYGEVERERLELAKGESYQINVGHEGTNIEDGPDYDYRAWIDNSGNPA